MEEPSKISLRLFQRKLPWRGPSKHSLKKNLGCICCMTIWPDFSRVLKWVNVEIITRQRLFTMGLKSSWIRIGNFVFLHIIFSLQLPKQFKDVSSGNFRNVIRYWKTNLWYVWLFQKVFGSIVGILGVIEEMNLFYDLMVLPSPAMMITSPFTL